MDYIYMVAVILMILPGFQGNEAPKSDTTPKIRCALPRLPDNVLYRLNNEGDRIRYSCRRGYLTLGDVFAACEQGQWSRAPPTCIARGCRPVYYIDHGRVVLGYGGAMVRVTCNEGYTLEGDAVMICDGRKWNTTIPKCRDWNRDERRQEIAYSHGRKKVKDHKDWLLEADYSCIKQKSSIRPPTIKHTIATTQWAVVKGKPRLYTAYRCHWGYTADSKAKYLYCQNGKWVGALPKCRSVATTVEPRLPRDQPNPAQKTHRDWLEISDSSCLGSTDSPKRILPQSITGGQYALRHEVIGGQPRLYAELVCNHGYRLHDDNKYVYCAKKSWFGPKTACEKAENDGGRSCGVDNGGCDHVCEMTSKGVSCSCKAGYKLNSNGRMCVDIDECQNDNGGCQHVCQNKDGSYSCHCYVGYQLSDDNHSCKSDPQYKGHEMVPPMALFSH